MEYSTKLKEKYEHIENLVKHTEPRWIISVDLKMINFCSDNKECLRNVPASYDFGTAEPNLDKSASTNFTCCQRKKM